MVLPEKNSSKYRSAVWFLDPRDKLDSNIRRGDAKYHAALSIMASKLAYENESSIKSVVTDNWNVRPFSTLNILLKMKTFVLVLSLDDKGDARSEI